MAYRTLTDPSGRTWEIWEVVPVSAERRRAQDPRYVLGSGADRRQRHQVRVRIVPGWEGGWLTFQCEEERRRVVPIPPQWDTLPDDALLAVLEQASPAKKFAPAEPKAHEGDQATLS